MDYPGMAWSGPGESREEGSPSWVEVLRTEKEYRMGRRGIN